MEKLILSFWVGAGGFIGASARYWVASLIHQKNSNDFPIATFLINITGCFILGLLNELSDNFLIIKPELNLLLSVGICGGFTTFSTFMLENYNLLRDSEFITAMFYTVLSVLFGFVFFYLGKIIIRILFN